MAKANRTPTHISAQDARGGEIILRTRRRRIVFLSGLVAMVVLVLILGVIGFAR